MSHDPSVSDIPDCRVVVSEPDSAAVHSVVDSSSWLITRERDHTASWVCDQSSHVEVETLMTCLSTTLPPQQCMSPLMTLMIFYHSPPFLCPMPHTSLTFNPQNCVHSMYGRVTKPVHRLVRKHDAVCTTSVAPYCAFLLF